MNALASTFATDPFHSRFGCALPRTMRDEITWPHMSWANFTERFSPTTGPLRLGSWTAGTATGGRTAYDATFGIGDTIITCAATTYGPIEALSSMLHDAGFRIEILSFHQQIIGDETATFVLTEHDGRREWAMGMDADATLSSIRAVIAGANLLAR
ncbi:alpha-isopropylmalate synthase regulatory domain-containing protein [Rhodococcus sp. IEGM 1381]|uniref:alpha-isopropylmalate synthase regulatory domain-containing protein n=1 Tax=Rhodococcus sp. IEGM 1381 TaxID=3047085 RepID=UPI0024B6E85C|nr:alpha-isopropylmalate synthase regulatory domain-containing protein [Rhodococcus sp. IEGM 1381]MDI9893887.1 alpha-isopropylmalate synthase regulatory domain-containing protein [Rhodococcus sp. IEGM 1381]